MDSNSDRARSLYIVQTAETAQVKKSVPAECVLGPATHDDM